MIAVVRMKAQEEERERLWNGVVTNIGRLQERLDEEGRLLYLSRRAKHEDISLFAHVANPDALGALIAEDLCKLEGVAGCWVINMLRPVFFPLPEDTKGLKRFAVTLKVFPSHLAEVYESLLHPDAPRAPQGIMMVYLALTCHLFGDCMQFSALAWDEDTLDQYVSKRVATLPGVMHTTVNFIEKTKPLVSYQEWKEYSARHSLVLSWNESHMVDQFTE